MVVHPESVVRAPAGERGANGIELGRATFVLAQGHFIAVGERGDLALVEVSPDAYKEKRKVRVLEYPCWTPPVISDGRLFLRNERMLLCYDLAKNPAP